MVSKGTELKILADKYHNLIPTEEVIDPHIPINWDKIMVREIVANISQIQRFLLNDEFKKIAAKGLYSYRIEYHIYGDKRVEQMFARMVVAYGHFQDTYLTYTKNGYMIELHLCWT